MKHKEAYPARYLSVMSRRFARGVFGHTAEQKRRTVNRLSFVVGIATAVGSAILYEYHHPQNKFLAAHGEIGRCAFVGVAQSHAVTPAEAVSVGVHASEQTIVFDVSGQPVSFEVGSMCGPGSISGVLFQASVNGTDGPPSASLLSVSFP